MKHGEIVSRVAWRCSASATCTTGQLTLIAGGDCWRIRGSLFLIGTTIVPAAEHPAQRKGEYHCADQPQQMLQVLVEFM